MHFSCALPSPSSPLSLQRTLYGLVGLGSVSDYVTKNSQTNVVRFCWGEAGPTPLQQLGWEQPAPVGCSRACHPLAQAQPSLPGLALLC